jgi:hypothetical protein
MMEGTLELTGEQKAIVILALADLALSRPGWNDMIGEIVDIYGEHAAWAQLKEINADRVSVRIEPGFMDASTDPELLEWLSNASHSRESSHSFVATIAEAGLRADHSNYPLIRPALLRLRDKYPVYSVQKRPA